MDGADGSFAGSTEHSTRKSYSPVRPVLLMKGASGLPAQVFGEARHGGLGAGEDCLVGLVGDAETASQLGLANPRCPEGAIEFDLGGFERGGRNQSVAGAAISLRMWNGFTLAHMFSESSAQEVEGHRAGVLLVVALRHSPSDIGESDDEAFCFVVGLEEGIVGGHGSLFCSPNALQFTSVIAILAGSCDRP